MIRQGMPNAGLGSLDIDSYCHIDEAGVTLLKAALSRMSLSARGPTSAL